MLDTVNCTDPFLLLFPFTILISWCPTFDSFSYYLWLALTSLHFFISMCLFIFCLTQIPSWLHMLALARNTLYPSISLVNYKSLHSPAPVHCAVTFVSIIFPCVLVEFLSVSAKILLTMLVFLPPSLLSFAPFVDRTLWYPSHSLSVWQSKWISGKRNKYVL